MICIESDDESIAATALEPASPAASAVYSPASFASPASVVFSPTPLVEYKPPEPLLSVPLVPNPVPPTPPVDPGIPARPKESHVDRPWNVDATPPFVPFVGAGAVSYTHLTLPTILLV